MIAISRRDWNVKCRGSTMWVASGDSGTPTEYTKVEIVEECRWQGVQQAQMESDTEPEEIPVVEKKSFRRVGSTRRGERRGMSRRFNFVGLARPPPESVALAPGLGIVLPV